MMLEAAVLALALLDCRPDPAAAELVQKLGSDSFQAREAASAALAHMGRGALIAVRKGCQSPDAEVAARCRRLAAVQLQAAPTDYQWLPWVDMLPANLKHLQKDYLDRAGWSYASSGPTDDWLVYRYATQLWARDLMEKGVPREWVVVELDRMAAREVKYRQQHNMNLP